MPIIVRHEPDPQFLADTGYQIGQGQAMQEQQEMQLRERMQQRAIYANMLSQRLAQQDAIGRQMNSIGAQFERQQQGFQQQDQLLQQRHEQAMELQRIKEENQRELAMQKQQWEQENILLGGMRDEDRSMGLHFMNMSRNALNKINELGMQGYQFSEDQQAEIGRTMNEIDKIHKQMLEGRMTNLQGLEAEARMAQRLVLMTPQLATPPQQQMEEAIGTVNTPDGPVMLQNEQSPWKPVPKTAMPEKKPAPTYESTMSDPEMRLRYEQLAMQAMRGAEAGVIEPEAIDAWIKKKFGVKDDKKTTAQSPPKEAGVDVAIELPDGA